MEKALRLQEQMALEKYEALNVVDKQRVDRELNRMAQERGYFNVSDMRKDKPYIWNQLCAQTVTKFNL